MSFVEFFVKALFFEAIYYLMISLLVFYLLYILLDNTQKKFSLILFSFILLLSIVNAFLLNADYGLLDTFTFSNSEKLKINFIEGAFHSIITAGILYISFIMLKKYRYQYFKVLIILNIVGFLTLSFNMYNVFPLIEKQKEEFKANRSKNTFHYSKEGKNIVVIMLDRAFGGFIPDVFKDEPALRTQFDGFTWYPNTLTTSNNTLGGLPTIFGGYNYNVENLSNYKINIPLKDKRDAAYKLFIDNFSKKDYELLYFAPSFAGGNFSGDCSIFNKESLECINTFKTPISEENIKSKEILSKIYKQLMTLSIFKSSPAIFKETVYQQGNWLGNSAFQIMATNLYKTYKDNLEMMIELSDTNAVKKNTFKIITNMITHSPAFTDEECNLTTNINLKTVKRFKSISAAKHFESTKCGLKILQKYFQWFKDNDIYDNTMFVIVSDHAFPMYNPMLVNITGKNDYDFSYYHSLLMIKPFKSTGTIKTDFTNRMNYEVPYIVCKEIGGCYDSFFKENIQKSIIQDSVNVFDTPWLIERQENSAYIINKKMQMIFPFNSQNTPPL